jgi:hypothetical protein
MPEQEVFMPVRKFFFPEGFSTLSEILKQVQDDETLGMAQGFTCGM